MPFSWPLQYIAVHWCTASDYTLGIDFLLPLQYIAVHRFTASNYPFGYFQTFNYQRKIKLHILWFFIAVIWGNVLSVFEITVLNCNVDLLSSRSSILMWMHTLEYDMRFFKWYSPCFIYLSEHQSQTVLAGKVNK